MREWLENDSVYHAIMNGALWVAFLAALSTDRWPNWAWLAGSITGASAIIAAVVYVTVVVCKQNVEIQLSGGENSSLQDQPVEAFEQPEQGADTLTENTIKSAQVNYEVYRFLVEHWRKELTTNYDVLLEAISNRLNVNEWALSNQTMSSRIVKGFYHIPHHGRRSDIYSLWMLHHAAQAGARSVQPQRRALSLEKEDEAPGRVVVTVGSVQIEISDDENQNTTNINIKSPKRTVVTSTTETSQSENTQRPRIYH